MKPLDKAAVGIQFLTTLLSITPLVIPFTLIPTELAIPPINVVFWAVPTGILPPIILLLIKVNKDAPEEWNSIPLLTALISLDIKLILLIPGFKET